MEATPGAGRLAGIGIGAAAVVAITLFRSSASWMLGDQMPLLFYVLAVLLAARIGGALPGLVTTGIATVAGIVFVIGPASAASSPAHWAHIAIFLAEGALISWIVNELRIRSDVLRRTARGLQTERDRMERLSLEDKMTGLGNRRAFERDFSRELSRCIRDKCSLTVVLADVNGLKRTNDEQGHEAGDGLIMASACALTSACRSSDSAYRIGGDEFAILMPETGAADYRAIEDRLIHAVQEATQGFPGTGLSTGAVHAPEEGTEVAGLMRLADARMYAQKAIVHGKEPSEATEFAPDEYTSAVSMDADTAEERSYLRLVRTLAAAVDARDSYTQSHSLVVAELVSELHDRLRLPASKRLAVRTAAMLHDVGKIGIPDSILHKPSPLSQEERAEIEQHPVLATEILHAVPHSEILPWIRAHHERWDGEGYPDGLSGTQIPLEARMITVCDAYEAMTAARPYHGRRPTRQAIDELRAGAGTQFDPGIVTEFVEMVGERVG